MKEKEKTRNLSTLGGTRGRGERMPPPPIIFSPIFPRRFFIQHLPFAYPAP